MTTLTETSEHYNGSIKIKFYPNSHKYKLEGEKSYLIGVTTATGMLDKSRPLLIWSSRLTEAHLVDALKAGEPITEALINEAVNLHSAKKEQAAIKGSMVHDWAEQYIKGMNPEIPEDEEVRNGVLAFLRWAKEEEVEFISSEQKVYSKKHEYVGTMDVKFKCKRTDHKVIHAGDFKTSSGIRLSMAFQVSAYQEADTEEHGTEFGDKCIIRFDKETGEFEAKWFDASEHKDHFRGFLACLELKKQSKVWDKVHGYYSKK